MFKKITPSYEEFEVAVKKHLVSMLKVETKEDVLAYLSTEEAIEVIKDGYVNARWEFDKDLITYNVFMQGCVSSVSNCLFMMY